MINKFHIEDSKESPKGQCAIRNMKPTINYNQPKKHMIVHIYYACVWDNCAEIFEQRELTLSTGEYDFI